MLTSELLSVLQMHGYFILFIIMVFEGSIVTYVAAFLASANFFNIYMVLALSILGNVAGDTIFFFFGRHMGRKYLLGHYKILRSRKIRALMSHARTKPAAALAIVKNSPLIPIPGLMLIGASGMKIKTFYIHSTYMSVLRSLLFTLLGYFSGAAFYAISNQLRKIELFIAGGVILAVAVWLLARYISKRIEKKFGAV